MEPSRARHDETRARWLGTLAKYRRDFSTPSNARHWSPSLETCSRDELRAIQNDKLVYHKGMGLVSDVFTREKLDSLKSHAAVGHVRYSTTGSSNPANAQPLVVTSSLCMIAVAHNGNLVNSHTLRQEVESQGQFFPIFHTTTDTEIILYLVARSANLEKGLKQAMTQIAAYLIIAAGWAALLTWKWSALVAWMNVLNPGRMAAGAAGASGAATLSMTVLVTLVLLASATVMVAFHSILAEE